MTAWMCPFKFIGHIWRQLGLGDNINRNIPSKIENLPPIKYVACGSYHTLFVDIEGIVYSCGSNFFGQLGLGDTIDRNIPIKIENLPPIKYVACGYVHTILVDCEGIVYSCGSNDRGKLGLGDNISRNIPNKIPNLTSIKYVACGAHHTIFVDFACPKDMLIIGPLGLLFRGSSLLLWF